jgi:uncharacterized protein DUF4345
MLPIAVWVVIVFFVGMGLVALVSPEFVTSTFGIPTLTNAGRNEVRAVYGGFGLAVAAILVVAMTDPALRAGVLLAVAASVGGMATGRLVAALVERPAAFYPSWFYFVAETAMAVVLYQASRSL